ncbi:phosphatidylserine lipase ABHD16A-like [Patiria miniata]|uniref:Abhydrolase domain-containing protein 16A n=1 Tax=Patiria miniata TaxID=46514 RepID=A0A913Z258_PATMI|nr:phosphatidylserine lipase ABHD16A-like [Patiria miniata]
MASLRRCIFGPQLYRIHAQQDALGHEYQPSVLERQGNNVVRIISLCWSFSYYTSPFLLAYLYRKNYFSYEGMLGIGKVVGTVLPILAFALCIRGIGRYTNEEYCSFLALLESAKVNDSQELKKKLQFYDFEFSHWPTDFRWNDISGDKSKIKSSLLNWPNPRQAASSGSLLSRLAGMPMQFLSYTVMHTVGRMLIYPGHTPLFNTLVWPALIEGRAKLFENNGAVRSKLIARDGNEIDIVVIDKRNKESSHGNKLVICCEGNAGFYEVGCLVSPLEAKYSVLGWNHPGFGGSTGKPFPENEANAVDVVIQYAIHRLGFELKDIILFAWSIGGYTASIAAKEYPDIGGVILDATFDDLVPLAIPKMPEFMSSLVVHSIRNYMNLNVFDHLCKYPGPIRLIRRSRDEVITTSLTPDIATNRANNLLLKLFENRYPKLMDEDTVKVLWQYMQAPDQLTALSFYETYEVEDSACQRVMQDYVLRHSGSFPMLIGDKDLQSVTRVQLVLYLAGKYMSDFDATHCTPLPSLLFDMPWSVQEDSFDTDMD